MSNEAPQAMSKDDVRRELESIVSSPLFDASPRNRQFLTFVVEETLAGRGARIKAYTVATRVFGRADDFDPLQDLIVRIEAARLRRALQHFYQTEGDGKGIRIAIPKGTYVPEFQLVGQAAEDRSLRCAWGPIRRDRCMILGRGFSFNPSSRKTMQTPIREWAERLHAV